MLVFGDRRFWRQLACSRLRDGGGKSFCIKKCEKRTGAGETPPPPPFPSRARLIFAFLSSHYVYYLRAWHRLGGNTKTTRVKTWENVILSRSLPLYLTFRQCDCISKWLNKTLSIFLPMFLTVESFFKFRPFNVIPEFNAFCLIAKARFYNSASF